MNQELEMGQEVLFFTSSTLKIYPGRVVGKFLSPDTQKKYIYQIEYQPDKREGSTEEPPLLVGVPEDNHIISINDDRKIIERLFRPFFKLAIKNNIKQYREDLNKVTEQIKVAEAFKESIKEKLEHSIKMKEGLNKN